MFDLSIIIPAYNEAGIIAKSLTSLAEYLANHELGAVEVIVVVAQSSDNTADIVTSHAHLFRSLTLIDAGPRAGKGRDVRLGIFASRGKYRLFMDADLATPLTHLQDVTRIINGHGKVGIAVRDLVKIHPGIMRKIITASGNALSRAILLPGISDTQCGFKVFEARASEEIFGRMSILGWGFDIEILAIARNLNLEIITFPAPDWHDPKLSSAGLVGDSPLSAALGVLRDLIIVRIKLWQGAYRDQHYFSNDSSVS